MGGHTDLEQLKVRVTPAQLARIDEECEKRLITRSALARLAFDHLFEVLPPVTPSGPGLLADAVAAFDRATMTS